jgi:hypothetical protein
MGKFTKISAIRTTLDAQIERRRLLGAGFGTTAAMMLPVSGDAAPIPRYHTLDLSDPQVAVASYVKLRGSTADETVFQPYEGDIFFVADGKVGIPLCGFRGIQKSVWRSDGKGGHSNAHYDVGFYVDYHTREILRHWDNPVTGSRVEVYHYRGGPTGGHFRVGAQGGDIYGDAQGRWSIIGDHIWHTSSNWGERPNPMSPAEFPLSSSGETLLGSMSISFAGRVSEVADPAIHMARGWQTWTNTTAWMPWMEMGQRPGFNFWRWIGAKGADPRSIDPALIAAAESVWPGYVHGDTIWKEPTSGRTDYMRLKRGLPLTR